MPGYYVHLATVKAKTRKNIDFIRGLEMPDLLKYYYKKDGIEKTREKYQKLKTKSMPSFSKLEERVLQLESSVNNNGLHYGLSSNPDIKAFWNNLSEKEKNNPFYRGYLWHLLTDLLFYSFIDIAKRIDVITKKNNILESEILKVQEILKLHEDWDKINYKIKILYPDIVLPKEINELKIVNFIYNGKTFYVKFDIIKLLIDFMLEYDPLSSEIEDIMDNIIALSNNRKNDRKEVLYAS
ncbi:MAG: hypothetical protein NC483_03890 [Ruminococcus sp.]|nr:hypothetical protein [Ruminococcus sp.]